MSPELAQHIAQAREAGFNIYTNLQRFPRNYRHSCGGSPIAVYTKLDMTVPTVWATCECGRLHCLDFWPNERR
jgi:hypothetical protein